MDPKVSIAFFISPHGLGHASRAAAVMQAVHEKWPFVHFEIFGLTPDWFFEEGFGFSYRCHPAQTDIGVIQHSSLTVDLKQTADALDAFLPFDKNQLNTFAERVCALDCLAILCDISPIGLAVGKAAGIPAVLIENFTWDWIYRDQALIEPRMMRHAEYLESIFASADCRIQVEPVCRPAASGLVTPPVCRKPRTPAIQVRRRLGLENRDHMVLITMGGIDEDLGFIGRLANYDDRVHFVFAGNYPELRQRGRLTFVPYRSDFYHPDLIHAADAVVGKAGYSTLAEVYDAGVPFGYVTRSDFIESDVLAAFIDANMPSVYIPTEVFTSGKWLDRLGQALEMQKVDNSGKATGAERIADYLCGMISRAQELLEVVTPDGNQLGAAPRCRVHGNNQLLHCVVHVLVFDRRGRLLLQKRSINKTVAAGKWDTSVGGHVDCGETIEDAVFRETGEELGIRPESPQSAYKYIHSNDYESELVHTFVCLYDGPIEFNPEEIDAVKFWTPDEIESRLGTGLFSDNFEDEFKRYQEWSVCRDSL